MRRCGRSPALSGSDHHSCVMRNSRIWLAFSTCTRLSAEEEAPGMLEVPAIVGFVAPWLLRQQALNAPGSGPPKPVKCGPVPGFAVPKTVKCVTVPGFVLPSRVSSSRVSSRVSVGGEPRQCYPRIRPRFGLITFHRRILAEYEPFRISAPGGGPRA